MKEQFRDKLKAKTCSMFHVPCSMILWPWLPYLAIFSISFIVFLWALVPPGILCPDSFYHTKMALIMKEKGIIQDFPWTQFTTYKDLFVDHHFGYHYLLIPFLSLPAPKNLDPLSAEIDPLIKGKLATAFFAALAFLVIYWFLKKIKVRRPSIWTMLGFFISPFLIRLSLTRAPVVSVSILILGIYFILRKKYWLLLILSFFYVWLYGAWPLILLAVIVYCLASAIRYLINHQIELGQKIKNKRFPPKADPPQAEKIKNTNKKQKNIFTFLRLCFWSFIFCFLYLIRGFFKKDNLKLLSACVLGLSLGLVINPYFPKTIPFYWFQTVKIAIFNYGILGYQARLGAGAEWYAAEVGPFYTDIFPILIPFCISLAWFILFIKRQRTSSWFLFLLSIFFFLYTIKARRNIEYFIPLAIFFSATIFTQINQKINWPKVKAQIKNLFQCSENIFYFFTTVLVGGLAVFGLVFYLNHGLVGLRHSYENGRPLNHLQSASNWSEENSEKGEIVFQSNWDIFPELFYFNTKNYYINGLDQTFMYEKDKDLYQAWLDLVSHKVSPHETAKILEEKFNASYVLLDKKDKKFEKLLKKSNLEKTYEDNEAVIYKVK